MSLAEMASRPFLLDTNILVHLVRDDVLSDWLSSEYSLFTDGKHPMICEVTAGEIASLALQFNWGARRRLSLGHLLASCSVVGLGHPGIIEAYAEMDDFSRPNGRPRSQNDMWIAATAHVMDARLLTTDRDFDHLQDVYINRIYIDPATA